VNCLSLEERNRDQITLGRDDRKGISGLGVRRELDVSR
jgi:hypothetical protein